MSWQLKHGIGNKNFLIRTWVYKRNNTYAKIYVNDTLDCTGFIIINGNENYKDFQWFVSKTFNTWNTERWRFP